MYSFVSVIHLFVGVVYCLLSWAVGLPKRAVSLYLLFISISIYLTLHIQVSIVNSKEMNSFDYPMFVHIILMMILPHSNAVYLAN